MIIIFTGNDEVVITTKDNLFIKEVYWSGKLIGYNIMSNQNIIDTYNSLQESQKVLNYLKTYTELYVNIYCLNKLLKID